MQKKEKGKQIKTFLKLSKKIIIIFFQRKKYPKKPAIVDELKWDKSAAGAISQIKEKEYCQSLEEYQGNLLLVGINYDVKTKEHSCVIEEFVK